MKVEVRLFATLGPYMPKGSEGDRAILEVPEGTTVGQIVGSLGIPPAASAITVVNGHDAPTEHVLTDGDELAMFPPLSGGGEPSS